MNKRVWVLAALLAVVVLALAGCSIDRNPEGAQQKSAAAVADLVIPVSDVTETASFYPMAVGDTAMEVLAVRASDGSIRTAFNTCQICYDSGRGYYKQIDQGLQCQNCGNIFSIDQVGIEAGGCNPWPIFDDSRAVDGENVTISLAFLQESAEIFRNWKRA